MLQVSCDGCRTSAFVDCTCAGTGHDPSVAGVHHPDCDFADLGAAVTCPPGSGCCQEDHSHDGAANSCPAIGSGHEGTDCPEPDSCRLWRNMKDEEHRALRAAGKEPPPCPGGHCHKDIPDCTVCRPVTITVVPGSVTVTPASGG